LAGAPQSDKKQSRIQAINRGAILKAALDVFSSDGYRGATIDRIAERAGLSKTNILYYFPSKEDIYRTVLQTTIEEWLEPLQAIDPDGDPIEELRRYISIKLEMSDKNPEGSRLFANEIQRGAPLVLDFLRTDLKALVDEKAQTIRKWISQGEIAAVDPYHLIFVIWATTQHYADFEVQIKALLGSQVDRPGFRDQAAQAVLSIILNGIRVRKAG